MSGDTQTVQPTSLRDRSDVNRGLPGLRGCEGVVVAAFASSSHASMMVSVTDEISLYPWSMPQNRCALWTSSSLIISTNSPVSCSIIESVINRSCINPRRSFTSAVAVSPSVSVWWWQHQHRIARRPEHNPDSPLITQFPARKCFFPITGITTQL